MSGIVAAMLHLPHLARVCIDEQDGGSQGMTIPGGRLPRLAMLCGKNPSFLGMRPHKVRGSGPDEGWGGKNGHLAEDVVKSCVFARYGHAFVRQGRRS